MSIRGFWEDNDDWLPPIIVITFVFILITTFISICIFYTERNTLRMIELCENHKFAGHGYVCENGVLIEKEKDEQRNGS